MHKISTGMDRIIGNTPLLRMTRIEEAFGLDVKLLAKLEYQNPAGSIKDRVALAMMDAAESEGRLTRDTVIIEPTSGNTGIALAAIGAARGYRVMIVMPDTMSVERRRLIAAYGAEIVLTPGKRGMQGAIEKAYKLAAEIPNSWIPNQFENDVCVLAHYTATGPEIYDGTMGDVDLFVAGVGTGGTLTGAGKYLKEKNPALRVVAVEPASSAVLSGGQAGAHGIQGIGAGFLPKILDTAVYDEVIAVADEDAYQAARSIAKMQGVLVGISSGAALYAAIQLAKRPENKGKTIVVILPDDGSRYLSTPLFCQD